MELRRHANRKPFTMRRYSTIEDNMTKLIRNIIRMGEQNRMAEDQINNNFDAIKLAIIRLIDKRS